MRCLAWSLGLIGPLLLPGCGAAPGVGQRGAPVPTTTGPRTVRLLFGGDVMLGRGVGPIVDADPYGVFADVRTTMARADLSMANLESPLTLRTHRARTTNALEATPGRAAVLAHAGFDAMTVANNHAGDAGPGSVRDTIAALRSRGIHPLGGGVDAEDAAEPTIVARHGIRVALLAFDASREGLRAGDGPGVAWWDPREARAAVRRARERADVVVVAIHGGIEYLSRPDPHLSLVATTLAGWGVDVVWGHGPHVVQPVSSIDPDGDGRTTVVATSLGNLLFDQSQPGTQRGALLEVMVGVAGPVAYRVAATSHVDRRVHLEAWSDPVGDAAAIDGEWWTVVRLVAGTGPLRPDALPRFRDERWQVVAAAAGDADGDGDLDVVVSFRQPYLDTAEKDTDPRWPWKDARGRSAHLGIYTADGRRDIWVAGTVADPVAALAVCDGSVALAHSSLDDPAVVATGAWVWRGFGFVSAQVLPGAGTPTCADVDDDGRLDPVITGRSSP